MGDDLRVCIVRSDLPEGMSEQRLTREVSRRLGYQVRASTANGQIVWYASGAGSAKEIAQEREREWSRQAGVARWRVRVDVRSRRDAAALARHLAAEGWVVIRRCRRLFLGAACEDDAKGLVRELSGDGRADAETTFRVRRVGYEVTPVPPAG
jgi:hypothetical protein